MDVMENVVADDLEEEEEPAKRQYTKELWFLLAVALVLALVMKTFLIQAFFIPSGSMEKTLHGCLGCKGDRVLVNKLVYKFRDVHRGEIVVFNGKGTNFSSEGTTPPPRNAMERVLRAVQGAIGFGAPGSDKDFIKRVIGIPGDVVACCVDGKVTVNGQPIEEPYVYLSACDRPSTRPNTGGLAPDGAVPGVDEPCDESQMAFDPVSVPEGHLFLMGDHRDGSSDSRFNGTVPMTSVVGRAFAIFWPLRNKETAPAWRPKILRVPETFDPPAAAAAPHVLGFALAIPITVLRRRLRRTTD